MIKVLTLLGNNYGGCLQAFALQHMIIQIDNSLLKDFYPIKMVHLLIYILVKKIAFDQLNMKLF